MALAFTRSLLAKALAAGLLGFSIPVRCSSLGWGFPQDSAGRYIPDPRPPGGHLLPDACSLRGASGPLEVLLAGHSQHHGLCPQAPIQHSPCGPGIRHLRCPWVILEMLIMIPVRAGETGRPMRYALVLRDENSIALWPMLSTPTCSVI